MRKTKCLTQDFVIGISGFIRHWRLVTHHFRYPFRTRQNPLTGAPLQRPVSRHFSLALNALPIESNLPLTQPLLACEHRTDS